MGTVQIVVDTSIVIAVLTAEPSRATILLATRGAELIAPASVHWEVGNALAALIKRRLATRAQAQTALSAYAEIPLRLLDVDLGQSIELAAEHGLYAYDAYLLACALGQRTPLLTLDRKLARAARAVGVGLVEIST